MELKDTIELMNSSDYKERFKAEYFQLKIRYTKLLEMLKKWDNKELNFEPTCPRTIYNTQIVAMKMYLETLEDRAHLENVPLEA